MKSKLITAVILVLVLFASVIMVVYFTANNQDELIYDESSNTNQDTSNFADSENVDENKTSENIQTNSISDEDIEIGENVTHVKMQEPLTLHSRYYKQGEAKTEQVPYLGWDGDMIITVKKAQLLPYRDADEEAWSDPLYGLAASSNLKNPAILLLEIELENIDAANSFGINYDFHANYHLQSKAFYSKEAMNSPDYFDPLLEYVGGRSYFSAHAEGDDYYTFSLPPGEKLTFQYGFCISKDALEKGALFLNPVSSSKITQGIELNQIEEG